MEKTVSERIHYNLSNIKFKINDYNLDVYLAPPHMVLLLDIVKFVRQKNPLSYHFYVPHLGFDCFTP